MDFNICRLFIFLMFDYELQTVLHIFKILRLFCVIFKSEITKLCSEPDDLLTSERNFRDKFRQGRMYIYERKRTKVRRVLVMIQCVNTEVGKLTCSYMLTLSPINGLWLARSVLSLSL